MSVTFTDQVKQHLVPIDTVQEYPDNPRRGDTKALRESIEVNDFYSVLIAQESTHYVLAGKLTGKLGQTFKAGKLGTYKIILGPDKRPQVILGPPYVFTIKNVDKFKF